MEKAIAKIIVPGRIKRNLNIAISTASAELDRLQALRKKANKTRKPYWQKRIDAHFGLA